jgi:exopolyphosphatase/guanosine-5'-triphosphate,3'-diphosphate pyrophosphatase
LEPIGVIDIGSNSVRLVVYEGAVRAPVPLFNEKILCGLGRSVASTGRLGEESVERALAAVARFRSINRALGVKHVRAIATAAVREASDGPAFISRAERAAGVRIQLLSGEREAELAAFGIRMGFTAVDGIAGDLGGGSLELTDLLGERLRNAVTLPLGGLRLIDVCGGRLDKAADIADRELGRVAWSGEGRGRVFYAVGGTWRALAKLHMSAHDYPLHVTHGYALSAREAMAFCEDIRKGKRIRGWDEISRSRREVLPYGALVLERALERLEPREVVFSVFGIREGLLYSLLSEPERARDPLLRFCEDYASLKSRSLAHARELCSWTDAIFTEPGPRETVEERRLRHAACLISDIGWRAHPDYRGEQSLAMIAHAPLVGVDHPGRIFLALSIYYRHLGPDEEGADQLSARLMRIADRRMLKRARIVGAAIRTAHMLSIGQAGIIDETPLRYDKGRIVLTIPAAYAAMDGERLRRRFGSLASLLDLEPEVRLPRR